MGTMPERNPIKRVAVLFELEDGTLRAVYAEPDPLDNDAKITLNTERPVRRVDWSAPGDGLRLELEPLDASVHVDHLRQLVYIMNRPGLIRPTLDLIQGAAS